MINHYNYWSPLACQVEEQEEPETPTHKKENLSVILPGPSNKIAAHWARKIANRKARTGILDTGATSGAGRPEDAELFENTGQPSTKVLMLPGKSKVRAHDYMKKPFAPIGCAVQVHVKPGNRRTWDTHTEAGYNLGTSMEHHRCFKIYVTKTRATRVSDTVFFKH